MPRNNEVLTDELLWAHNSSFCQLPQHLKKACQQRRRENNSVRDRHTTSSKQQGTIQQSCLERDHPHGIITVGLNSVEGLAKAQISLEKWIQINFFIQIPALKENSCSCCFGIKGYNMNNWAPSPKQWWMGTCGLFGRFYLNFRIKTVNQMFSGTQYKKAEKLRIQGCGQTPKLPEPKGCQDKAQGWLLRFSVQVLELDSMIHVGPLQLRML